jgi:hypothetical protein
VSESVRVCARGKVRDGVCVRVRVSVVLTGDRSSVSARVREGGRVRVSVRVVLTGDRSSNFTARCQFNETQRAQ